MGPALRPHFFARHGRTCGRGGGLRSSWVPCAFICEALAVRIASLLFSCPPQGRSAFLPCPAIVHWRYSTLQRPHSG
eukprot:4686613-Pyramimonas_sp.AAC.1